MVPSSFHLSALTVRGKVDLHTQALTRSQARATMPGSLFLHFSMEQLIDHAERLAEDRPELNAIEVIQALSQLHTELDRHPEPSNA
jgi:hypothetical protein